MIFLDPAWLVPSFFIAAALAALLPRAKHFTNSIGMEFARIEPGAFIMGSPEDKPVPAELADELHTRFGDFDEHPAHVVRITKRFHVGAWQVTNAQYEQFDPDHRKVRGKLGFSTDDDEAVVFVTWHDAARFCKWLSAKEGLPYRLPTEAEWEYACRAGTTGPFHTGDRLPEVYHRNQKPSWFPDRAMAPEPVIPRLRVATTPPNPWGLHDMHGLVEEWCSDWYGPYAAGKQTDPVGYADGTFRVTRGGSHSTPIYYLRSANRSGTIPDDCHWLIGFRVVLGAMPATAPLPPPPLRLCQREVKQAAPPHMRQGPDPTKPYFLGPREFVKIPPDSHGPLFSDHNHVPTIVECPNGDLLAAWYTCVTEPGREVALAASRLRCGQDEWEPASPFWDAPDRTEASNALWFDGERTIYHFIGLSASGTWGNLVVVMRSSTDSGASWSRERIIVPQHGLRRMPIPCIIRAADGSIVLPCDAVTGGHGGTALHISRDNSQTWADARGTAAGIHAGIVQLPDRRLMTLGRGDEIDGRMAMSLSSDMGRTWTYRASPFPPISIGQRLALLRLREGPIMLASFAENMLLPDASGGRRLASGLFTAVSPDEGQTWPLRRLVVPDYLPDQTCAEPGGYLTACQGANGLVHLISSRRHYAFNLAWLTATAPSADEAFVPDGIAYGREG